MNLDHLDNSPPDAPYTWHRVDAWTRPDGSVVADVSTNDDEDRGYPTTFARWVERFRTVDEFTTRYYNRTGISGVQVIVTLDGAPVERGGA